MGETVPTWSPPADGGVTAWAEAWGADAAGCCCAFGGVAAGAWAVSGGFGVGVLTRCLTFFGGGGGGRGTLCADGGGNGEASGEVVFSCCCAVCGGFSVPLPVCKGGACAWGGGVAFLNGQPVQKMDSSATNEHRLAALIPGAPWQRLIRQSCSRPA
jgi:hypothetical protein